MNTINTRIECEELLKNGFIELVNIYKQYNPKGTYLTFSFCDNILSFNNAYFSKDADKPINLCWNNKGEELDV